MDNLFLQFGSKGQLHRDKMEKTIYLTKKMVYADGKLDKVAKTAIIKVCVIQNRGGNDY